MLDTIKLRSPFIDEGTAAEVEQACSVRSCVCVATGEVEYSITTGSLAGSFDEKVSVRVLREEVVSVRSEQGKQEPVTRPTEPYLVVEGSVHKALLGHNVFGGPCDPVAGGRWFVDNLAGRLGVVLPDGLLWRVMRLDWAEVYELPSFAACSDFIHGLAGCSFPRRKVSRYGDEAVHAPGVTTTIKVYHKGPEFFKHDRLRWRELDPAVCADLEARANKLLRVEVSIKSRKLADDHGGEAVLLSQVTQGYCERLHDREALRLLREADLDMEKVRTHVEVGRRLREEYDQALAQRLFGLWMQLSALGEKTVKGSMNYATFYRQRKQLVQAGVSWLASDVRIVALASELPSGFSPTRGNALRLVQVAGEVRDKLAVWQQVAA